MSHPEFGTLSKHGEDCLLATVDYQGSPISLKFGAYDNRLDPLQEKRALRVLPTIDLFVNASLRFVRDEWSDLAPEPDSMTLSAIDFSCPNEDAGTEFYLEFSSRQLQGGYTLIGFSGTMPVSLGVRATQEG